MLLQEVAELSTTLATTASRRSKMQCLADLLSRLEEVEVPIAACYLSGELPQGRLGVGPALLGRASPGRAEARPQLDLVTVNDAFERLAVTHGPGSDHRRRSELTSLLERATPSEQVFLTRLLLGELRQGAQEGVMLDALARASGIAGGRLRRAHMLAGSLSAVAGAALGGGEDGLARFTLSPLRPLRPMLAATAEDVAAPLAQLGRIALEYKLDGARVQIHKQDEEVRVFTRQLNDVTAAVPELVALASALPARAVVLDGEAITLRRDGSPNPFQVTMRRFGRRLEVEKARRELPLSCLCFDCLHIDGEDLIDRPAQERREALEEILPASSLVPRKVTGEPATAQAFLREALARGHEGVMAKALHSAYEAGTRGRSWLKVKPAHTLDLVVLAAEWGSGRRRGWLSNLHLGAPDGHGGHVMLGKTFKGLSDEMLKRQTELLLALETSRDGPVVYVRPELVVEVAFNEIQASRQYPAGMALRFARVRSHRFDKRADQADSLELVRQIFDAQGTTAPAL